ncbi:MAG TPA: hypothetical protein VE641_19730 [Chthoniobacterales bacterium]|nr:hypothetical protein [Chthoniobacterales bacterium]
MLPDFAATDSIEFQQGRLVDQEEERARIAQAFHDDVSCELLAADDRNNVRVSSL